MYVLFQDGLILTSSSVKKILSYNLIYITRFSNKELYNNPTNKIKFIGLH